MNSGEENWDIHQPTRQSYLGVVVYLLRNFRAMISLFLSLIAAAAAAPIIWTVIGFALVPLLVLFALLAYWQYRNFTFHIEGDDLIIHKGVFVKEKKSVPIDRIQSIQLTRNVAQRLLGLVALKVDTAGSRGNELEIPALERPRANALKDMLYRRKEALLAEEEPETTAQPSLTKDSGGTILVKLGFFDLIKVGITENHLKTGFLAIALVFGYASQYQEYLEEYIAGYVDTYASEIANAGITLILSGLILYALFSVLLSLIRVFLQFFDLKAVLKEEAVEISTGLLKRNEYRVPINKIQYIQWETNPLRWIVGFESAKLKTSNSVGEVSNKQSIEIPALKRKESRFLAEGVFEDFQVPVNIISADAWAYARLYALLGALIFVPAAGLLFWHFGAPGLGAAIFVLLAGALGYRYGLSVKLKFDKDYVQISRGWIFPERIVIPTYKSQSISLGDNVLLRRRGLTHLKIYTAAGNKTILFLNRRRAEMVYDYLLFAVERYRGSWM